MSSAVVVKVGQIWRFTEPSGRVRQFEITNITRGPYGDMRARGKTASGAIVTCPVLRLARGQFGAELVHERYVRNG